MPSEYAHVVALDPPAWPGGEAAPREPARPSGFAHLAWGPAEVEFALTVAERTLDMRAELVALYKELRAAAPLSGGALGTTLQGPGAHPRSAAHAARLVAVLTEVGLVAIEPGPTFRLLDAHRTELERSPTYMRPSSATRWRARTWSEPPALRRPKAKLHSCRSCPDR